MSVNGSRALVIEKPKRRLDDWITSYIEWVTPRVRVPPQYTAWCSIFALSTALERKVKIPRKYLGGFDCDPFLFIMLIGDPGIGKGTSMSQVKHLLYRVGCLNRGENIFTKERLFQQLVELPRSSVYLILGEFADVLQKNKNDVFDLLLTLYDGTDEISEGTRMRSKEIAVRPCLNFIAGTTSAWIIENITSGIIGGGLPSRISWVYADSDEAGPIKVFYDEDVESDAFDALEDDLVHDLEIIANMEGDMKLTRGRVRNSMDPDLAKYGDENAGAWFESWCQSNRLTVEDPNMQNFFARKRTHLHKIAMIRSISLRDDMVITIADYEFAINAVEKTEKKVHKVLGRMGKNIYVEDTMRIRTYITENGPVDDEEIRQRFESAAEPRKLDDLIRGMELAGIIAKMPTHLLPDGKKHKTFWVLRDALEGIMKSLPRPA